MACSVALLRVQLLDAWARYDTLLKVREVVCVCVCVMWRRRKWCVRVCDRALSLW